MCGIAGAVSAEPVDRALVERMCDRLAHRGPDAAGVWSSEDGRVCLGHRRLAIVDLSPEANQPFLADDGRVVLTLNGEIYNFRELREELAAAGAVFRTRSDTEVLLEAYRQWGRACLDRLDGMFAFAIWDAGRGELFCARDRAGEKPFYYAFVGRSFVFASELKSLLLWPRFERSVDYAAVAEFLTFGAVPDPRTAWTGAAKLPPGHALVVSLGAGEVLPTEPTPYWDLTFAPDHSVDDWGEPLRETLEHAAAQMAYADVPVATFLSGGIDSSSVTAALARAGSPLEAYTIGFADADYDERPWARLVASSLGTTHHERVVRADDVDAVFRDTILWHYDEPFNDYSYLPTYYVCREARRNVTVALTGDGGDELFAGYSKYRLLARREALDRTLTRPIVELAAAGARSLLPASSGLRGHLAWYERTPAALLTGLLTTGLGADVLRGVARGPLAEALEEHDPRAVVEHHLRQAPPAEVGLVNAMRYLDFKLTLGAGILTKVDRAAMAVSLETRPVFLHPRMIELAARIPPRLLADAGTAKKVLKQALRPWLPQETLTRPKAGFAMPLGRWLRGRLGGELAARLGRGPVAELVDDAFIQAQLGQHASGAADRTGLVHSLMFLDHWLERWA